MESSEGGRAWLGQRIKSIRTRQGLKLRDMVERSGLSISTLSKIENGHHAANFENLVLIAAALDTDAGRLLSSEDAAPPTGRRSISRSGESNSYTTAQYVYEMLCADLARKKFVPLLTQIKQRSIETFGPLVRHEGEEFVYVLEGTVELHTEFYAPTTLRRGDSAYFDSVMGHALVSPEGDGQVLWISSMTRESPKADERAPRIVSLPEYERPQAYEREATAGPPQIKRSRIDQ